MLFHVTATHTEDECPGYNMDNLPALIEAYENLEGAAENLGCKILFSVNGAPGHDAFMLIEGPAPFAVAQLLTTLPFKQSFDMKAVTHDADIVAGAKQMMASQGG